MNPKKHHGTKKIRKTSKHKKQAPFLKFNRPRLGHENGLPKLLFVHELVHACTRLVRAFAVCQDVYVRIMCFMPQALEWNWMTSLETIHQALNSVAFYIIATWDLFTVYFSVFLLHQWLSSKYQSLGSPPNSAPTLLPTKLILPPWLEQATLLEKHLPVAKLHSTSGNLVLDSWELDLQKSLGMSLFFF